MNNFKEIILKVLKEDIKFYENECITDLDEYGQHISIYKNYFIYSYLYNMVKTMVSDMPININIDDDIDED